MKNKYFQIVEPTVDNMDMRVLRKKPKEPLKPVTVELRPSVIKLLDEAAKRAELSRQKLLGLLLQQVLTDRNFVLKIDE